MIQVQTGWDRYHRPLMGRHQASFMMRFVAESQTAAPVHVGFFLDVSQSMGKDDKLNRAKEVLLLLLNHLRNGDRFTLATFHGKVTLFASAEILNEQNRPLLADRIRSLEAGGVTRLDLALECIKDRMASSDGMGKFTFLVSDGFPTDHCGRRVTDQQIYLNTAAQIRQQGIPVVMVALGNPESYDPLFFNALAEKTQGSFRYSPDAQQLAASLIEDIRRISNTGIGNVRFVIELNPRLASCDWVGRAYPDKQFLEPIEENTYILGSLSMDDPIVVIAHISSYGDLDASSGEHSLGTIRILADTQTGSWEHMLSISQDYTNRTDLTDYLDETVHRWYLELEETAHTQEAILAKTNGRTDDAERHIQAALRSRQSLNKETTDLDAFRKTLTEDDRDRIARLLEQARKSRLPHQEIR